MSNEEKLTRIASQVRRDIIRMVTGAASGHPGGSLSSADFVTALFFEVMEHSPEHWDRSGKGNDMFFLSAGHLSPLFYSVLARSGYFPVDELSTFRRFGSRLQGHPSVAKGLPGVYEPSGSLGQGLSVACGAALGKRLSGDNHKVYVLCGDGESQEGQIWEGAEAAGAWKLDNLFAFLDLNGQQLDGYTKDIIPQVNIPERWQSFGWDVHVINGHDFEEIEKAIEKAKSTSGKPHMIVMNTIKSYGYIPGEGIKSNHSMPITPEAAEEAIKALKEREGRV